MSCYNCIKPCILGDDGRCRIAKIRIGMDSKPTFKDAWQLITGVSIDDTKHTPQFDNVSVLREYQQWKRDGEPVAQYYDI